LIYEIWGYGKLKKSKSKDGKLLTVSDFFVFRIKDYYKIILNLDHQMMKIILFKKRRQSSSDKLAA